MSGAPHDLEPPPGVRWRAVALLAAVQVLAMGLWFSASAVVPQLAALWQLGAVGRAGLTIAVQLGFVVGALGLATLDLADRMAPRRMVAAASLVAATANALITWPGLPLVAVMALRFVTGAALAAVYPPGIKLVATWTRSSRGLAVGVLVGALTLGSAVPHLLDAWARFGGAGAGADPAGGVPPWRPVLLGASALAVLGAVLAAVAVRAGPLLPASRSRFDPRAVRRAFGDPAVRLANLGYLGHMWELYAVWAWLPVFLLAQCTAGGWSAAMARLAGFAVLAVGAVGCIVAGFLADRLGRTRVAGGSLVVSGGCCLAVGAVADQPTALVALALVWGFAVVADSAQFSAAVSELADADYVGTALTVQTALGFLVSAATIQAVPWLVEAGAGWPWAFAFLALGPAVGVGAMLRLRRHPAAVKLAGGRR